MEGEKQQLAPSASCEHVDTAAITPGSATTPDAACILCQICTRPSEKKEKLKEIPVDGNTPEKAEKEAMEKDSLKPKDNDEEKEKSKKKPEEESDGNASFLRAARAGNLDKVLEYLKGSTDINTSNANGLNALHLSSKEGHVNIVQELLARGADVNAATKKGNTALHIASLAGQKEIVKILVEHGATVNCQSQNGFTPLYMAAQENHDEVVQYLLDHGANQSTATEDGFTPLAVALQQGHDKVVAVLLENDTKGRVRLPALHIAARKDDVKAAALLLQNDHNADVTSKWAVNAATESGFTPLHIAAHYGHTNVGTLLLNRGANVNFAARNGITPLHVAAKWGRVNMVTLLMDRGGAIDSKTRDGLTPLHCAARSGHDQVVDLLLERGAPILAKTKNGLAPLHMAAQGDHVDSARILLYHKAPVDEVTVDYLTALHVAAHCGHVRVAKLLLDRKANPDARALNGFTPLHIACKKNRIKVVELLLKHGASIHAVTESGLTPIHVAAFMGHMNIVLLLLQNGASPDATNVRGETPLHLAARANQTEIIRILLRNGAQVDARAREDQTPLHIAARLGNVENVILLLQHGASPDATTKDLYTALHIAAKEGHEDVASVLLEHGASLSMTTKKGFTPLHVAAKYGTLEVASLLLRRYASPDAAGKNGLTPLHVAAHYDNVNVALLLLDQGASPHATAKNGYTPLHIAAKKNQMEIATTLLEYGAEANATTKQGIAPIHLASQEGHTEMVNLLLDRGAKADITAKNGLTPLHLAAQEDQVPVASILVKNGAEINAPTKAGYTPLHVACHYGNAKMVEFLLQNGAGVNTKTKNGFTPLHQAAQQGHNQIVQMLLAYGANPNEPTNNGNTPLDISKRLGYISVVDTLTVVTETVTRENVVEEKQKLNVPETMNESFMSDASDEEGEETITGDTIGYLTVQDIGELGDDSIFIGDVKAENRLSYHSESRLSPQQQYYTPALSVESSPRSFGSRTGGSYLEGMTEEVMQAVQLRSAAAYKGSGTLTGTGSFRDSASFDGATDNIGIPATPVHAGFLVSFMVDARGGAMRGCRQPGFRIIIPPRKATQPTRITCRLVKRHRLQTPPPLMEGEALASRVLEIGPAGTQFLGPVIIELPHFASLRGREREIVVLRSDSGENWREHTLEATEEAIKEALDGGMEGEGKPNPFISSAEIESTEELQQKRIVRILTTDFPQYFAVVTRVRMETKMVGPEGGMLSSSVVPQVQAVFPEGALTKKIRVGLQAQPVKPELVKKMYGNRVLVSPIVTVEPRRRKFHKPITMTIPLPSAAAHGIVNGYGGGDTPTLRLLCSITEGRQQPYGGSQGGPNPAQWEDITGSTPLTFVNDCVSFTTTVSARFWLMDCRQINESVNYATQLYREVIAVPFMAKFVVFAKTQDPVEARLRVFCMTDDKYDKTLEKQEHFTEIARSRDVEVLEGKTVHIESAGNLIPLHKSGEQLHLNFYAFRENRLPFLVKVKDSSQEPTGRLSFMPEPKTAKSIPPPPAICNLNVTLPEHKRDSLDLDALEPIQVVDAKVQEEVERTIAEAERAGQADRKEGVPSPVKETEVVTLETVTVTNLLKEAPSPPEETIVTVASPEREAPDLVEEPKTDVNLDEVVEYVQKMEVGEKEEKKEEDLSEEQISDIVDQFMTSNRQSGADFFQALEEEDKPVVEEPPREVPTEEMLHVDASRSSSVFAEPPTPDRTTSFDTTSDVTPAKSPEEEEAPPVAEVSINAVESPPASPISDGPVEEVPEVTPPQVVSPEAPEPYTQITEEVGPISEHITVTTEVGPEGEVKTITTTQRREEKVIVETVGEQEIDDHALEEALRIAREVNGETQKVSEQVFSDDGTVTVTERVIVTKTTRTVVAEDGEEIVTTETTTSGPEGDEEHDELRQNLREIVESMDEHERVIHGEEDAEGEHHS
ncbi:uncharacterized protein LOC144904237 isoform X44 [Branchiostoma floridae x Branchiostoma belcheri]